MNQSNVNGATLFVKKIVSLNPIKYDFVSLEWAMESWGQYLLKVGEDKNATAKGFRQWLKTEI